MTLSVFERFDADDTPYGPRPGKSDYKRRYHEATRRCPACHSEMDCACSESERESALAPEPMPKRVAVCVFIRDSAGRYLLMRRHENAKRCAGMWMVPGGIVHAGESVAQAAARECREEIGCELAIVEHLATLLDASPDFVLVLVRGELVPGQEPRAMEPDKHGPPQWLDAEVIEGLVQRRCMPESQMYLFGGCKGATK